MGVATNDTVTDILEELTWEVALDRATNSVRNLPGQFPLVRSHPIRSHRLYKSFLEALENDPSLNTIFPDDDEEKLRIRSHRPSSVAEQLINHALWRSKIDHCLNTESVLAHVKGGVNGLRRLVTGRKIKTPVWVGFGGNLPADTRLATPWGVLRPWRETDRLLVSYPGSETASAGGCVLETETAVHWTVLSSERTPGTIFTVGLEDDRWKRLCLAFLLTAQDSTTRCSKPWFCSQSQGLGPGIVSSSVSQFIKGPTISAEQLAELGFWMTRVSDPALSIIAADRATTMVGRISDHVDALIDGVIVWENLFAQGNDKELSFRVSLNMACVLEDDPAKRIALQVELKKLYELRSRIVHGGFPPNSSEVSRLRARVQDLTLLALKRLLQTHFQLLGKQQDSFTRFLIEGSSKNTQT